MNKNKYLVYGLIDTRQNELRYVGKSSSGMSRPRQHQRPVGRTGNYYKAKWLRELYADDNKVPAIIVLGYADSKAELCTLEIKLIAFFRELGFPLTNLSPGGDGGVYPGFKHTPEGKLKISMAQRGRSPSEETRAKMRLASTGRKQSAETRAAKSLALKGRKPSAACLKASAAYHTGIKHSYEWILHRSQAMKGKKHSPEAIAKRIKSYVYTRCVQKWINTELTQYWIQQGESSHG